LIIKLIQYIEGKNKMFNYTVITDRTIDDAIHNLEESLKQEKFGVLWMFDIKEKLQEKWAGARKGIQSA
jgi:uncharacterized protein (DUF302 family)